MFEIVGNYNGEDLGFKFTFGSMEPNEYAIETLRPMLEKECEMIFTAKLSSEMLEGWKEHLHEGLDDFFEQIIKTVKDGVRWKNKLEK